MAEPEVPQVAPRACLRAQAAVPEPAAWEAVAQAARGVLQAAREPAVLGVLVAE